VSNRIYVNYAFIITAILKITVFSSYCTALVEYWASSPHPPFGSPDVSLLFFTWLPFIELITLLLLWFPKALSWFAGICSELFQLYQINHFMLLGHLYSNLYLVILILLIIVKLFFLLIPETRRYYRISLPSWTTSPATKPPLRTSVIRMYNSVPGE